MTQQEKEFEKEIEKESAKFIVFGARGRVGRAVVAEARARGYEVTEAGRADGDVTSAVDVARLAAGHDVAVVAAYDLGPFRASSSRQPPAPSRRVCPGPGCGASSASGWRRSCPRSPGRC